MQTQNDDRPMGREGFTTAIENATNTSEEVVEDTVTETVATDTTTADALNAETEALDTESKPDENEAGKPPKTPQTMEDLAERLGVEVKDLYGIKFSTEAVDGEAVGQTRTIGELKDLLTKETDFLAREVAFEENRIQKETELLKANQELQMVVTHIGKENLNPELLTMIRERHELHKLEEENRLLNVIPTWNDEKVRDSDRAGMLEHLAVHGYDAGFLDNAVDHKFVKYIRDNWVRWKLMSDGVAAMKLVKATPPGKPSTPATVRKLKVQKLSDASPAKLREAFKNLG